MEASHRSSISCSNRRRRRDFAAAFVIVAALAPTAAAHRHARAATPPVTAPGYCATYLAQPNPIQMANGLAMDSQANLYIDTVLRCSITKVNLLTGARSQIASDSDPATTKLQGPDDMAFDSAGNLYATEFLGRQVAKISPDGTKVHLPGFVTDGLTAPNGIAFRGDRLFVSDLTFDPSKPGGIWEVDPSGVVAPHPVLFQQLNAPEAFAFGADGYAYVPEFFAGNVAVVDVDAGQVVRRVHVGGILAAIKFDHQGRIIVLQSDTGTVLRGDSVDTLQPIAHGKPGFDNVVVAPGDYLLVSNYLNGNVYLVDADDGVLLPLFHPGPATFPVSLSPASDGGLWVANFSSVMELQDGQPSRIAALFLGGLSPAQPTLFTAGVVENNGSIFYSDALPPIDSRITQFNPADGSHSAYARVFALPTHVRQGPNGSILVIDQVAGILAVTDGNGGVIPLAFGLASPSGLAYDAASDTVYVSESAAGDIRAINLTTNLQTVAAAGLVDPEGVTLDGNGNLLVVEGDAGRLTRISPLGVPTTVAVGLPTQAVGPSVIPGFNLSSDVIVRDNGEIDVTGDGDGSIIRLRPGFCD